MIDSKLKEVRLRYKELSSQTKEVKAKQLQRRLIHLIDVHGIACVAAATGLAETTVAQYTRPSAAKLISEKKLTLAERILEEV